jgi:hypothetical protein
MRAGRSPETIHDGGPQSRFRNRVRQDDVQPQRIQPVKGREEMNRGFPHIAVRGEVFKRRETGR